LKASVAARRIVRATYARLYCRLQWLRSTRRDDWWWPGDHLGKPAKVLRNCGQRELEQGTARPAQSQPAKPQDTLQMRKQHLLAISGGAPGWEDTLGGVPRDIHDISGRTTCDRVDTRFDMS